MKLFSNKNIKYIFLTAISFFWSGSLILAQENQLSEVLNNNLLNIIGVGINDIFMALGIFVFILLYKKVKNIKKIYIYNMVLCIIFSILFFVISNPILKIILFLMTSLLGSCGFGVAFQFSLIANRIEEKYLGRIFTIGYSLGVIGTWLLCLNTKIELFTTYKSLFILIPSILINIFLVYKLGDFECVKKSTNVDNINKKSIYKLCIMIILMCVMASFSANLLEVKMNGNIIATTYSRLFYAFGLIIAGILVDKNKKYLSIITVISLIFPVIALIYITENISANIMYSIDYFLAGFLTVFRAIFFMYFGLKNEKYLGIASLGLLIERIIEGITMFFTGYLLSNYLVSILLFIFVYVALILYYFIYYDKELTIIEENDIIKNDENSFEKFCDCYKLNKSEKNILKLLLSDFSNKEISDKMFLSLGTVKNAISRIYKKTNMKKEEIKEKITN